ncbi:hypothetical protein Bca52824_003389 [Brassica carinata]|uniref:RRM domain-containing protein n=1 Tax=Brassica carinata TaxID=52824 RepID=A0A8X7WLX9_BRACI|nr:hypothetical protein Bca52824_003389 [Brassica carinata]
MSGGGNNVVNRVVYATSYQPIQAGSIDGTDVAAHDNGDRRALLCHNAGLYDPFGDAKAAGDPYCTLFVGRISHLTTEDTLREAMTRYGKIKSLRLVRHIVTGASRGYAFVECETEKEMRRAHEHLMSGWIPRRFAGGGLGGRKESGQLRFGGRERPFRAPLRPIPHEDLKKLGIQLPPEGRYMSRTQIPSPPRRKGNVSDREKGCYQEEEFKEQRSHVKREGSYYSHRECERAHRRSSKDKEEPPRIKSRSNERSRGLEDRYGAKEDISGSNRSNHGEERPRKRHKHRRSHHHRRSSSPDHHSSE